MYIKRLETLSEYKWKKLLDPFTINEWVTIRSIFSSETKEYIIDNMFTLEELGIVNGIGPSWFDSTVRAILTLMFQWVDFRFHDIQYFIGWSDNDRSEADFWLFKYSCLSILDNFEKIHSLEIFFLFKEILILLLIPISMIKFLILILFWRLLVYFGAKAFNYN